MRPTVLAGLPQDAHEAARQQAASFSASRRERAWVSPVKKKALEREREQKQHQRERQALKLKRVGVAVAGAEAEGDKENSFSLDVDASASASSFELSMSRSMGGSFEATRDMWSQRGLIANASAGAGAGARKSFTRL